MVKKKTTKKAVKKNVAKKVVKKKVRITTEDTILVQIPDLTDEVYEQLVSLIREKCPTAEIFGLQRECLYEG